MEKKGFWKEFAEVIGYGLSWQEVVIGALAVVIFLLIAGIGEYLDDFFVFGR